MKKMSTVLAILLLVPLFTFAAPKVKVTLPILKKQVSALMAENKSLKAEIALLKAQKPQLCAVSGPESRAQEQQPLQTTQPSQIIMPIEETPTTPKREVRFNASAITDDVEVNGIKTAIGIMFQVQNLKGGDVVTLSGVEVTSEEQFSDAITYKLPITATNFTVVINGEDYPVEVIVKDTPNRDQNSSKHIHISPLTQFVMI